MSPVIVVFIIRSSIVRRVLPPPPPSPSRTYNNINIINITIIIIFVAVAVVDALVNFDFARIVIITGYTIRLSNEIAKLFLVIF